MEGRETYWKAQQSLGPVLVLRKKTKLNIDTFEEKCWYHNRRHKTKETSSGSNFILLLLQFVRVSGYLLF